MSRSPHVGIKYLAMQKLWRLAGSDHLHVNGLGNKFTEGDTVVTNAARAVQAPLNGATPHAALPVFSSGQTAWQVGPSMELLGNDDFLFCAGGGIMSHPYGPAAGITSLRQAAAAQKAGEKVEDYAKDHPELAAALTTFKSAVNRS
jgi:ribulose-bisphosphate carboxylase large chain